MCFTVQMLVFLDDFGTAASGQSQPQPQAASFEETVRQLVEWHAFYDEEHRAIRNLLDTSFLAASAHSLCSKPLCGRSEALLAEKDASKQMGGATGIAAAPDLLSTQPVQLQLSHSETASESKPAGRLGGFGEVGFDSSLNRLLRHFW